MTHHMDDFAKAAQAFLEEHGSEYLSPQRALDDFVKIYNTQMQEASELEQLLDQAFDLIEYNPKESKRLFLKAQKLAPDDLTIKMSLLTFEDDYTFVTGMTQLEKEEKAKWQKGPKMGWVNLEERDYLRLKETLAGELKSRSLYRQSIVHYQELLKMNPDDNLGARYELMVLYVYLEDFEAARQLLATNPHFDQEDDLLLLPLLFLSIQNGKIDQATTYFEQLVEANPDFLKFVEAFVAPNPEKLVRLLDRVNPQAFRPGTLDSLLICLEQLPQRLSSDYIVACLKELSKPYRHKRKEQTSQRRNIIQLQKAVEMMRPSEALVGITGSALYALQEKGLISFEKFKKKTEAEVAAIKGVGPKTIQQLKTNGVVFRQARKKN